MLPTQLEITGHPENPTTFQMDKTKEQNGVTTFKSVFTTGNELQIDVRHSDEKKQGAIQYERHNFDVKYTIFNEDTLRGNDVYHFYTVIRRKKGTNPITAEENLRVCIGQMLWILPRIIAGEY